MSKGTAEKTTPTPMAEASAMDETPSISDLINKIFAPPPNPSVTAPMTVSEPMQYNRKAVSKPSEKRSFLNRNRFLSH